MEWYILEISMVGCTFSPGLDDSLSCLITLTLNYILSDIYIAHSIILLYKVVYIIYSFTENYCVSLKRNH